MRKSLLYLIIIIITVTTLIPAQSGAEYCSEAKTAAFEKLAKISKINYPGDSTIDVTYYKLNLTVTYSPKQVSGIVTVKAKSLTDGLTSFYLDLLDNMTVDYVTSGTDILQSAHANDKISITLKKAVSAGEEFSVDVYYHGVPITDAFGSFAFDTHNNGNDPCVWTLSEPYGAKNWWPCKDTPGDKADSSDVWIKCPTYYTAVSNGLLQSVENNGNGMHTFKWKNSYPIAQYLISFSMANYDEYDTEFDYGNEKKMPIVNYVYPENLEALKPQIDRTANMIKIFSDKFGLYPFINEKYGHAQIGFGGGMEHQTMTSLTDGQNWDDGLISHELAHQWFGDKITCKDWQNIWLNESFATYSESVYYEALSGKTAYQNDINAKMSYSKNVSGSIYVRDISSVSNIFNTYRSYFKGSIVLHMLRGITGDSVFFNILKSYLNDPALAYNVATTEDFERVAEEVSGMDLKYFFQEWIYGENYPVYSVFWYATQNDNGSYKVSVRIAQSENTNPEFFTMPIEIQINMGGSSKTEKVFNDNPNQTFEFDVPNNPTEVILDPNNLILKSIGLVSHADSPDLLPTDYSLSQNYPNPFNPTTRIQYILPKAGLVQLKIIDLTGREITNLVNEYQPAGNYDIMFDAEKYNLSSGVYIYRLTSGDYSQSHKMVYLK